MAKSIGAIVLAAGKGTRMKSPLPKVLHTLCGMPMLYYAVKAVADMKNAGEISIVVGYEKELVKEQMKKEFGARVKFAVQKTINGTGKAIQAGLPQIKSDYTVIMCGDSAVFDSKLLEEALAEHAKSKSACTIFTKRVPNPHGLGRIIRNAKGAVDSITEQIALTPEQIAIDEINTGSYILDTDILKKFIVKIKENPKKKEYFFTDIIELLNAAGKKVSAFCLADDAPFFSVNALNDLHIAEKQVKENLVAKLFENGVRVIDPDTTFIGPKVTVGEGTVIYPFTFIENGVTIGAHCAVGPFAKLRQGAVLQDGSELGSFAEIVRSTLGKRTKMKHLSYMGDVTTGADVNIGAGVVFANYDGKDKHKTFVGDNAFIGSNSVIVSPVKIGKGAVTGAGSAVTKDVLDKTVVVGVPARPLRKVK